MGQGFFDNLNGKQAMFFGIVSSVAVMSTAGFLVLLFRGGSATVSPSVANIAPPPAEQQYPPEPTGNPDKLSAVTKDDHIRGNPSATVTLIEFSDFECPFCGRHIPTIQQILDQYKNKVRLVYRHFPLNSIHPNAQKAAEASECASDQGKFWEYHDVLFDNQQALTIPDLKRYAGELRLNQKKFDNCLDSGTHTGKVAAQTSEGEAAGVNGTPATFVNGQLVSGAQPFQAFASLIDAELAK